MAKKMYIGVNNVARKVKKIYVGVNGVARKVKKAYIGVSGVARQFFGGGELAYYGKATRLNASRTKLAATSIGNYALFGGGVNNSSGVYFQTVDTYSKALTKGTAPSFTYGRSDLNAAAFLAGNYAVFGSGFYSNSNGYDKYTYYSSSLTIIEDTNSVQMPAAIAVPVGDYVLFSGGYMNTLYVLSISSTLTRAGLSRSLAEGQMYPGAARTGNYAIFAGGNASSGYTTTQTNKVTVFNASLTQITTANNLGWARGRIAATTIGNYALFGGGLYSGATLRDCVEAYNTSLTKVVASTLTATGYDIAATTVGDYALFGGGYYFRTAVDAYDASLVKTNAASLEKGRQYLAATSIGDYALFGGGLDTSAYSNVVEVYSVS